MEWTSGSQPLSPKSAVGCSRLLPKTPPAVSQPSPVPSAPKLGISSV